MKKNTDLNELAKLVGQMAQETTKSASFQMCKQGIDEVFKQVNEVLDETMKSMKEHNIDNSKVDVELVYDPDKPRYKKDYSSPKKTKINKQEVKFTVNRIPSSSVGGILFAIFGAIGTGLSALITPFFLFASILDSWGALPGFFISGGMLLGSLSMLAVGIGKIKKLSRFKRYRQRIGDSLFCNLNLLMEDVGKRKNVVINDLKEMRVRGYLRDMYFDKDKQCVMLDHETYAYYEQNLNKQLTDAIAEKVEIKPAENISEEKINEEKELIEILEKGQQQLLKIEDVTKMIKNPLFLQKAEQFHKLSEAIFSIIQKSPDKINDIRKVHEYYLPTVIKLLNMYVRLDAQLEETQNIKLSKQQIEEAFNTLNRAFEELLNGLFEEDALDIYADISVLNMMLTQEGLLGNDDFKKINE